MGFWEVVLAVILANMLFGLLGYVVAMVLGSKAVA